jgi:hypothetical protein
MNSYTMDSLSMSGRPTDRIKVNLLREYVNLEVDINRQNNL